MRWSDEEFMKCDDLWRAPEGTKGDKKTDRKKVMVWKGLIVALQRRFWKYYDVARNKTKQRMLSEQ